MLNLQEPESRLYEESEEFIQSLNDKSLGGQHFSIEKPPLKKHSRDLQIELNYKPSLKVKKAASKI